MSKKYYQVGNINVGENEDTGEEYLYLKLGKQYEFNKETQRGEYTTTGLKALIATLKEFCEDPPEKGGINISIKKPSERLEALVRSGHMSEEEAEQRLKKMPKYIKYELVLSRES